MSIQIEGRDYTAQIFHHDPQGRPSYMLTGKRGAVYMTIRFDANPELMSVMNEKCRCLPVLLTDRNGALEVTRAIR